MNRRACLALLLPSTVVSALAHSEPTDKLSVCDDAKVNQHLREIGVQKLGPDTRNRAWNLLALHMSIFHCRLESIYFELKKIEKEPHVVSLGVKRAVSETEEPLKRIRKAFEALREKV